MSQTRLLRLAQILENKYGIFTYAAEPIDYKLFKKKATSELQKHVVDLANLIRKSQEFRDITFKYPNDPYITFSDESLKTIEKCKQISSTINFLYNNMGDLSLEEMAKPFIDMSESLLELLNSKGSDRWGLDREKYLSLIDVYSDIFTTQGAYHDRTRLDPMAKRELDRVYGRLTKLFDDISYHLRNRKGDGILDILKRMAAHGLIDSIKIEQLIEQSQSIGDTSRVPATVADHELRQVMSTFMDELGLTNKGLSPQDITTWKKYLPDNAEYKGGSSELSSAIGRMIYHALGTAPRYEAGAPIPAGHKKVTWMVGGMPREKLVGPSVLRKVLILKDRLDHQYAILKAKEREEQERQFGQEPYRALQKTEIPFHKIMPPPVTTSPPADYRELVSDLQPQIKDLWDNLVPRELKVKLQQMARKGQDIEPIFDSIVQELQTVQDSSVPYQPDFSRYL
jgi:hypothetical protein